MNYDFVKSNTQSTGSINTPSKIWGTSGSLAAMLHSKGPCGATLQGQEHYSHAGGFSLEVSQSISRLQLVQEI